MDNFTIDVKNTNDATQEALIRILDENGIEPLDPMNGDEWELSATLKSMKRVHLMLQETLHDLQSIESIIAIKIADINAEK